MTLVFTVLAACAHDQGLADKAAGKNPSQGLDANGVRTDYRPMLGMALQVAASQALHIVPTQYDSPAGESFSAAHPLVLQPGDAFAFLKQEGTRLLLRFDYPEIATGWVDVHAFPARALSVALPSTDPKDEVLPSVVAANAKKNPHAIGTQCALTPYRPGCSLAAVKYKMRDMHLVHGDFSNFPPRWQDVGCAAAQHPQAGLVCTYKGANQTATIKSSERHVEIFDGAGWYFGLGHQTLQSDGKHTCVDCRMAKKGL